MMNVSCIHTNRMMGSQHWISTMAAPALLKAEQARFFSSPEESQAEIGAGIIIREVGDTTNLHCSEKSIFKVNNISSKN